MTVGLPMLAWGLLACALPIVIHLVLRERPRPQTFPALRFLTRSHAEATRRQRLRNLLLLLARILLIALLVTLLMRLACTPSSSAATPWLTPAGTPVSAVFCLDDSASTGYRFQGRTRLDNAAEWARELITDDRRIPPGSQIALITGSDDPGHSSLTRDPSTILNRLNRLHPADHDHPVADLLSRAADLLENADHEHREIFLLTDMTRHAWRSSPPATPDHVKAVYLLDVGQAGHQSTMLGQPEIQNLTLPADRNTTLPIRVRTHDQETGPVLELLINDEPRMRHSVGLIAPQTEQTVLLPVPALPLGRHRLTLQMEPEDALPCDNRRFAAVTARPPPKVVLLNSGPDRQVPTLVANMIAPSAQPVATHPCDLQQLDASRATPGTLSLADLVILADVAEIDPGLARTLIGYTAGGGFLLVIPGPNFRASGYENLKQPLGHRAMTVEECPEPLTLAATGLSHPYLEPFAEPGVDSINARLLFKRLIIEPAEAPSRVLAPFTDGQPALLTTPFRQGRSLIMAFSPAREWSRFGTRAAPMIVLLQTVLKDVETAPNDVESYIAGDRPRRAFPTISSPTVVGPIIGPKPLELPLVGQEARLPATNAGHYRVFEQGQPDDPELLYAVNVSEGESDPRRVGPEIVDSFASGRAKWLRNRAELNETPVRTRQSRGLTAPLALSLFILLIAESLFANRIYGSRRPPSQSPTPRF